MSDDIKALMLVFLLLLVGGISYRVGVVSAEQTKVATIPALHTENASHVITLKMHHVEEFRLTNGVHCAQSVAGLTCNWAEMNKDKEKQP